MTKTNLEDFSEELVMQSFNHALEIYGKSEMVEALPDFRRLHELQKNALENDRCHSCNAQTHGFFRCTRCRDRVNKNRRNNTVN